MWSARGEQEMGGVVAVIKQMSHVVAKSANWESGGLAAKDAIIALTVAESSPGPG